MKSHLYYFAIIFLLLASHSLQANVTLPHIFSNGMVLQRNQLIPVWGWADPGEEVVVGLNGNKRTVITGSTGKWLIKLQAEKAGGPYRLTVSGKNTVEITDVLIGEVWICSGQSNMRWPVESAANASQEMADADFPQIRQVIIPRRMSQQPMDDTDTAVAWKSATPEYVGKFTAVGYFYARELYRKLRVPIGLINTVWGGTMIEAWISKDAMSTHESLGKAITVLAGIPVDSIKNNSNPNKYPTLLFNAMIHPLILYSVRGAIWYQGEGNTERAFEYRTSFPLLINDWRERWGKGNFSFYFVQLSSFNAKGGNSLKGSTWAELREAQHRTLSLPNTGEVITIDIGASKDIHPLNKQDVGKRLAAIALCNTYGIKTVFSGPVFTRLSTRNNKITISFKHIHKGLTVKEGQDTLRGFEVAGDDRLFYPAYATIKSNKVEVMSPAVQQPRAVRYGWADDAGQSNLFNIDGFPAAPFRTDDWPMITRDVRYKLK